MKRTQQQEKALKLLDQLGELLSKDPTTETIEQSNQTTEQLERTLAFQDKATKNNWLEVLQGFKCWEDFEELTKAIIERMPLLDYKESIIKNLNAISCDFVGDNYIENDSYLSDLFTEFADNQVSVYCYNQKQFYFDHSEECERDFLEIYDGDSIADIIKNEGLDSLICKVGAVGWFYENERELYECEEEIKAFLLVQHVLENTDLYKGVDIGDIIDNIKEICTDNYDTLNDYCETFQERTLNNENQ